MDLEWVGADDQVKQQMAPLVSASIPSIKWIVKGGRTTLAGLGWRSPTRMQLAFRPQTVFALTHKDSFVADSGGLWRSTDGGSNFEELTGKLKSRCHASDSSSRKVPLGWVRQAWQEAHGMGAVLHGAQHLYARRYSFWCSGDYAASICPCVRTRLCAASWGHPLGRCVSIGT